MRGAKYSPVGPIGVLQYLQDEEPDALGHYVLLIAHDVLDHPLEYAGLTNTVRNSAEHQIILDNGVIEHGEALSTERLIEAAHLTNALTVVLPDVLRDKDATIELARLNIETLFSEHLEPILVPQGKNTTELVECVDTLRTLKKGPYSCWGIPRWIANDLGSRIPIVQYINQRCEKPWIHLLGMSHNISDDLRCTKLPNVQGIDSANPIVLGLNGITLGWRNFQWQHMDRGNYWESNGIGLLERAGGVLSNIQTIRDAIG